MRAVFVLKPQKREISFPNSTFWALFSSYACAKYFKSKHYQCLYQIYIKIWANLIRNHGKNNSIWLMVQRIFYFLSLDFCGLCKITVFNSLILKFPTFWTYFGCLKNGELWIRKSLCIWMRRNWDLQKSVNYKTLNYKDVN